MTITPGGGEKQRDNLKGYKMWGAGGNIPPGRESRITTLWLHAKYKAILVGNIYTF